MTKEKTHLRVGIIGSQSQEGCALAALASAIIGGTVTPMEDLQAAPITCTLRPCDVDAGWLKSIESIETNKKNSIVRNPCLPKRWKKASKQCR